jgi:hypothetical protein
MKYLYSSPLPEAATTDESDSLGQQLSELGLLNGDSAAVESVSSEAADLTLEGQYRWGEEFSTMVANELDELANAGLSQLPLYQRDGTYQNQGFYEIKSADVKPVHANRRGAWEYTLSLTNAGKRGSKFRGLSTNTWQPDHPWGNTMEAFVGIPANARKARWLASDGSGQVAPASSVQTVAGKPVDVALYDVEAGEAALGSSNPTLVYDAEYAADVLGSVRVYDTRGYSAKFSNSGDGPRQWQICHSTEHDIENAIVLSNGIIRVQFDEFSTPDISADEWDESTSSWVAINAVETDGSNTDWTLADIDLTEIGMQDVRCQLEFEHPTQGLYDLNASLQVGRQRVLFYRPKSGSDPVPSGLETWLSSIAADWILDPKAERGLVARSEVRA